MLVSLRPLTLDDTGAVHEWASMPEARRYQAWGPNTETETLAYVREAVASPPSRRVLGVLADD
ncbi:GNAT family N-acetyltransferase [Actinoplanes sp. NPDC051851]|uniref:GNAT family N-acetyltransferase n=1 Tax=Actinoplanes sp. NPDC051851 TaxID=3154753 RepID=UPI003421B3ED